MGMLRDVAQAEFSRGAWRILSSVTHPRVVLKTVTT